MGLLGSVRVLLCLKLMLRLPRAGAVLCLRLLLCLRETPKKGRSSGVSEGAEAQRQRATARCCCY